MNLFWVSHNNTCSTARVITEGLIKSYPEINNLASREDVLWLRKPSEELFKRWEGKQIGHFPDSNDFVPELATPDFWNKMSLCSNKDVIILTINAGNNHNAKKAIDIISSNNLYDRTLILDEDESAQKCQIEFSEIYEKAKVILVNLGDKVLFDLKQKRNNVLFFGFNGIEDRYLPKSPVEKDIDVFFKSRVEGWLMPRAPFRDKLIDMNKKGLIGNSCIMPPFKESEGDKYFKIASGNRHHPEYYNYLNRSRIAVYLNGYNPIGYQFWENAANKCLTLHQTPWKSLYYNGGNHNPKYFHWEMYDPPFIPGEDFLYFETPEDLEEKLLFLMKNPGKVKEISRSCHNKALNFTSERQAQKFIKILKDYFNG